MTLLRNGASAVDAVEMAIKVLEDREITNAGYGSNLAIDGTVEGDAVVVDHLGRSGGVGAVARKQSRHESSIAQLICSEIKNPISLARVILDQSTQELTLRRVPPNLLVGQGATDFAYEQNMAILPNDALVSPAARDRWYRWRQDLKIAERKAARQRQSGSDTPIAPKPQDLPPSYEDQVQATVKQEHAKAVKAAVWNEGQPISPPPSTPNTRPISGSSISRPSSVDSRMTPDTPGTPASEDEHRDIQTHAPRSALTAENLANHSPSPSNGSSLVAMRRVSDAHDAAQDQDAEMDEQFKAEESHDDVNMSDIDDSDAFEATDQYWPSRAAAGWHDGSGGSDEDSDASSTLTLPSITPPREGSDDTMTAPAPPNLSTASLKTLPDRSAAPAGEPQAYSPDDRCKDRKDCVTDTVGAIAIDSDGNIACGASSGGIGMKFRGRIGPAALVGVGAAVVPVDAEDKTGTCTGAVTSGTGEHMGTTLAASVCAERLYHGQKKRRGGGFEHCEDDQAIRSMIENDFMGLYRPGLTICYSLMANVE